MDANGGARGAAAPRVYRGLRGDIVDGRLKGGMPLVEGALAARFQVSRTPIREALGRLEQDGLVQRGTQGYEVRGYTAEELYELYETRILLEGFAARCAAERHGPVDAARIQEAHRRMGTVRPEAAADERVAANRDFHTALWQAARNRTTLDVLSRLHLHVVRHTTLTDEERWARALEEHGAVLDAVLGRDPARAEEVMVAHLETGRDVAVRLHHEAELGG